MAFGRAAAVILFSDYSKNCEFYKTLLLLSALSTFLSGDPLFAQPTRTMPRETEA